MLEQLSSEECLMPSVVVDGGITDVRSGWMLAPLDLGVAQEVEKLKRSVIPDMPDRIIAATAVHLNLSLVTCDSTLRSIALNTIW
jgi:PIN domain nuclease of toxin-antitoxin system